MALFVRHEPAIHSFLTSLLADLDHAEVVMQETSLAMWKKFDQFKPGTSFRNWAFQIARFEAVNFRRKRQRDRHLFSHELGLIAGVYLARPGNEPPIAVITEMNGALQWTGDRGRVVDVLGAGNPLHGGTLESLSADSWAVLTFCDGSAVTVSGRSMLTISEDQQKEIHLREGSLSASIAGQPDGRPLLIHTPTARLEVLGTQFDVDAEQTSTTLHVNEGRVRVTRLADGSSAEVPADHQVMVSASGQADFRVRRQPDSVRSWRSSLPEGVSYGQWISGGRSSAGNLQTAPILLNCQQKPITLHLAAISISRGPAPAVVLTAGCRFHVRGRISTPGKVYFGLTTKHVKGGFAGKYVTARQFDCPQETDQLLNIELPVEVFRPQEEEFADSPTGLELVDWWCFTYNVDTGLSIANGKAPTLLIDAEEEHFFRIEHNGGRVYQILKQNGVPTEYHVLKGVKHFEVYGGETLDRVMRLEIAWFDKHLKSERQTAGH